MSKPRIGAIVKGARERCGLSRARLASQAEVSAAMITRLEHLDKEPNPAALARILAPLGLTSEQLKAASSVPWRGRSQTSTIRAYHIGPRRKAEPSPGPRRKAKPGPDDIPLPDLEVHVDDKRKTPAA